MYRKADEVATIAHELIDAHHEHLRDAPIVYLFTDIRSGKGCQVAGKVTKVTGKAAYLAYLALPVPSMNAEPHDPTVGFLCVEIDDATWDMMNESERRALVDHELSHCDWAPNNDGIMAPVVLPHDVEEFRGVIDRHGLWTTRLFDFAQSARRQLEIDFPAS